MERVAATELSLSFDILNLLTVSNIVLEIEMQVRL